MRGIETQVSPRRAVAHERSDRGRGRDLQEVDGKEGDGEGAERSGRRTVDTPLSRPHLQEDDKRPHAGVDCCPDA